MKMIMNGKMSEASDKATIEVINPANGLVIDTVPSATKEDVDFAISAAKTSQKIWAKVPVYEKGEILKRFIELVDKEKDSLSSLLSQETGKPITEARDEIGNIPIAFHAYIEKAKHLYDEIIPAGQEALQDNNIVITKREPIGVVICVVPFNFPSDMFNQKVAPALLCGNAVIVKPSTDNPLTLCRLTALLVEAGVTDGAIQILTGRGSSLGNWLCQHPDADSITLTGSTEVGIQTAKNAAEHLARVALELGGNDAFILCEDGDMDLAIEEMVFGRMYNCGQVCCSSKRFLIANSVKEEFTKRAIARLKQVKCGDPADEATELACLISEEAAKGVEEKVNLTVAQGGKIALGGKRQGAFYEPTVIIDVPKSADVMRDMEIFGPVVPITGFDTIEEAIEIANNSIYGLCGGIFTKDMKTAYQLASSLECGTVVINGSGLFRSFEMPFGGYKHSGIGTEGVISSFDEMSLKKSIVLKGIF